MRDVRCEERRGERNWWGATSRWSTWQEDGKVEWSHTTSFQNAARSQQHSQCLASCSDCTVYTILVVFPMYGLKCTSSRPSRHSSAHQRAQQAS